MTDQTDVVTKLANARAYMDRLTRGREPSAWEAEAIRKLDAALAIAKAKGVHRPPPRTALANRPTTMPKVGIGIRSVPTAPTRSTGKTATASPTPAIRPPSARVPVIDAATTGVPSSPYVDAITIEAASKMLAALLGRPADDLAAVLTRDTAARMKTGVSFAQALDDAKVSLVGRIRSGAV